MEYAAPIEPRRRRPSFRNYGIHAEDEGMLPWSWASERLTAAHNYWLATTRPDGRPHAMPLWGVWLDDAFCFGTGETSAKARNLEANPAAVLHLESGDETVIVEGTAEKRDDEELARRANELYEPKYGWRIEAPQLYVLRPTRVYAWSEESYTQSATQFDF